MAMGNIEYADSLSKGLLSLVFVERKEHGELPDVRTCHMLELNNCSDEL